jgi:hypothetical protein
MRLRICDVSFCKPPSIHISARIGSGISFALFLSCGLTPETIVARISGTKHVYGCEWFKVYDFIERIWKHLKLYGGFRAFEEAINDFFVEKGIGWQLVKGEIITRGTEAFEATIKTARATLEESGRPTAAKHIHEALMALSRRPEPDLPGAVYHAMGSLECVARDVTGDHKITLGDILKRHPGLVPPPLNTALSQVWGYVSNEVRHVKEGRELEREEAELVVGLAGTVATYLGKKFGA